MTFNQFASIIGFRLDDFEWKYDDELANYCKILKYNLVIINHEEQKFYYFNNEFTSSVIIEYIPNHYLGSKLLDPREYKYEIITL